MRAIEIDAYRDLIIVSEPELLNLAGVDRDDDGFTRDQKIEAYLHRKQYRLADAQSDMDSVIRQAIADNMQILITKGNQS